jgi:hypothetical protein
MRIFTHLRLVAGVALIAVLAPTQGRAQSGCEAISRDVAAAITKDPTKTLLIVEDALVINEGCAGDIVRAAIIASKADGALVNQIVQTATGVAPKRAAVIAGAANSVAPGAVVSAGPAVVSAPVSETVYVDKNPVQVIDKNPVQVISKNPVVEVVQPPAEEVEEFRGYASFRGIYLIQPPPTGFPPCDLIRKCDNVPTSPCGCAPKKTPPKKDYVVKK